MSTIIAGMFENIDDANNTVDSLLRRGVEQRDVTQFANSPPGQHGQLPIGGDENADPGAKHAHIGALTGAGIGAGTGAAIGAIVAGPPGSAVGAGIGAYVGSLAGALESLDGKGSDEHPLRRPAGVVIAVRIDDAADEGRVIEVLKAENASHIEKAEGVWRDGRWEDFDPVEAPRLLQQDALDRIVPGRDLPSDGGVAAVFRVEPVSGSTEWQVANKDGTEPFPVFASRLDAVSSAIALANARESAVVEVYGKGGHLIWRERYPADAVAADKRRWAVGGDDQSRDDVPRERRKIRTQDRLRTP